MFSCFNAAKNLDRPDFVSVAPGGDSANDLALSPKIDHAEHLSEKIAAVPNLTLTSKVARKEIVEANKAATNFDFDPTRRFVRELTKKSEYRRRIAEIVKENSLGGEGGSTHIMAYINDEQHAVPSLPALRSALATAKSNDLLLWASRYNLFVLWSADKTHPWDLHERAERVAAVLDIGKVAGTKDEAVVLLDGVRIKRFEFTNSVFKTLEPVTWTTPSGEEASVHLELRMSTFFGYGKAAGKDLDTEMKSLRYLGTQAHGIMWPAADHATLPDWPIAPPMVAGKVNVAVRSAAVSPSAADTLSAFEGAFQTHFLPKTAGHPAMRGVELVIGNTAGTPYVSVDGKKVERWTFGPNNVLAWEDEVGHTAWLQLVRLSNGPILVGNLYNPTEAAPEHFNLFGELKGQPSRLSPTSVVDAEVSEKVAAGLGVAATLLLADVLSTANRIWSSGKRDQADDEANAAHSAAVSELSQSISALLHLEDLCEQANRTFLQGDVKGGVVISKDIDPNSVKLAQMAEAAARDKTEAAKIASKVTEKEARDTEEEYKAGNAAMSTYKASQTAWKASQTAEAAHEAEQYAVEASQHARNARTAASLDFALAAAQAYNQARIEAYEAAKAERRAATAALRAVEGGIDFYAKAKNFDKLKEIAEASGVATKALSSATEAVEGWEADSTASRNAALMAARSASEQAQECYKHMRRVQPAQQQ